MINKLVQKYKNVPVQVKASFWFLIASFFGRGISVITTPIFTRLLNTTEYGQFSVFSSWLGILTPIITLNIYSGVYIQGLVKFDEEKEKFSSSLQGLCLTMMVIWICIYLIFKDIINGILSLTTIQVLAMLVMIWSTAVFNFWSVEQRVNNHYQKLVGLTIAVTVFKPVLGIILVLNSTDKVTARILGLALVELIAYLGLFVSQMRRGKKIFSGKYWKYVLGFNIPLIPHYLSMKVLSSSDRIMIEKLSGASEAGIYSLAYSVSMIMSMINTALMQTIEPWLYKQIKNKSIEKMSVIAYPAFFVVALTNLVLIAFAPEIITIFAPKDYQEAVWVIPPVAMSVYFMFAYTFFAVFEFYFEQRKYIAIATTVGAILNIVLNYFAIQVFGYIAAGYTTLICYILFSVFHLYFMCKLCNLNFNGLQPYSIKVLLGITIVFMAVGFVFLFTYNYLILRYLLILVCAVVVLRKRRYIIDNFKMITKVKK